MVRSGSGRQTLLQHLKTLREQNKQILDVFNRLYLKEDHARVNPTFAVSFPIRTEEDLITLENDLTQDNINVLTVYLSSFGGEGVTGRTNRILKEILADTLACGYSFYGKRSGKKAFALLKLRTAIVHPQKLLHHLTKLENQNKQIIESFNWLNLKEPLARIDPNFAVNFPIQSEEDLITLENTITQDNINILITYLSSFGGDGIIAGTNRILRNVFTDSFACGYSFYGRRSGKKAFAHLKLRTAIVQAVKIKHEGANNAIVENAIKVWLKHAPQRHKLRLKLNKQYVVQ